MIAARWIVGERVVARWTESDGLVADPPWLDLVEAQMAIGGGMAYEALPELEALRRAADGLGKLDIVGEPNQLPADAIP